MSRIGKQSIQIPEGVTISTADSAVGTQVSAKGPKGELQVELGSFVTVEQADNAVSIAVEKPDHKEQRSMWGTARALVSNIVEGVSKGFEKRLQIVGVGYKARVEGKNLVCDLGYSHPKKIEIPEGLEVKVEGDEISVVGIDKQLIGQFAAEVREFRSPEPYKGKGIRYKDEYVIRKEGKRAGGEGEA